MDLDMSANPDLVIGWREWLALPDLGVPQIKAKVDTGARTSALHAFDLERFRRRGRDMLRFTVHPYQRTIEQMIRCEALLIDERVIRNSGGGEEHRPVIETRAAIGEHCWTIELTLTRRDVMGFRMLLGRQAVRGRTLVNPGRSYLVGKKKRAPATLAGRRRRTTRI
jgi:hypothetical protein